MVRTSGFFVEIQALIHAYKEGNYLFVVCDQNNITCPVDVVSRFMPGAVNEICTCQIDVVH